MLFKVFKDNGVLFAQPDFEGIEGSYESFWKTKFATIKKERPNFGTCPNQAAMDIDDYEKLDDANPPLRPFESYKDL